MWSSPVWHILLNAYVLLSQNNKRHVLEILTDLRISYAKLDQRSV